MRISYPRLYENYYTRLITLATGLDLVAMYQRVGRLAWLKSWILRVRLQPNPRLCDDLARVLFDDVMKHTSAETDVELRIISQLHTILDRVCVDINTEIPVLGAAFTYANEPNVNYRLSQPNTRASWVNDIKVFRAGMPVCKLLDTGAPFLVYVSQTSTTDEQCVHSEGFQAKLEM